jgi:deoxyribodipyrimidine photolyase-like uncharacterized protein
MAYFSNGTEGMNYESQYCDHCIHFKERDSSGSQSCPIWDLHFEFNYDQHRKTKTGKAIARFLSSLIPMNKDGFADECSMFSRTGATTAQEEDYFEKLRFGSGPVYGV